jgi:hypothetical protein
MASELVNAWNEILMLKEQLLRKTEEVEELELMVELACEDIDKFSPHEVKKIGNLKVWDPIVTQLVINMLAQRTPPHPSCIAANILSVVKLLVPTVPIVDELLSKFVRF